MVVGKLSKSKIVVVVQTLSTRTQFPPATSSGAMSSLNAASMADGQNNRTKPALDVRTNQRTHFGTSKKDVAYRSDSHSRPHHTSAGSSVSIETNGEVAKRLGQSFFLLGRSSSPLRTAVGLSWVAIYASLWMGKV